MPNEVSRLTSWTYSLDSIFQVCRVFQHSLSVKLSVLNEFCNLYVRRI